MGLFSKKIEYSGKVGDIVRIPCKQNSSNILFTGAGKAIEIYEALLGSKKERRRTGMANMDYFGLTSATDSTEVSYSSGYTATHVGNGNYHVKENKHHEGEYIAMEIIVGASPEVAENKKSNVNKWIRAVAKPKRGFWWWVFGIVTTPIVIGIFMLVDAFYRLGLSFVKNSCLRKAKKSYKKNGKVIVF